jgi:hypothetical protein
MHTPIYETPYWTIFWLIFAIAGSAVDIYSSEHFEWYGLAEKNKLVRRSDGTFDMGKDILYTAIIIGISFVIGIISYFNGGGFWGASVALLIPMGIIRAIVGYFNLQAKKKKRKNQIEILTAYRTNPDANYAFGAMESMAGRSWFNPFQFLSVPTNLADMGETMQRADQAIRDYATNVDPQNWFKY